MQIKAFGHKYEEQKKNSAKKDRILFDTSSYVMFYTRGVPKWQKSGGESTVFWKIFEKMHDKLLKTIKILKNR